jgi:tetratricopeptide (TPR) repeat protein/tRNA A-37 threonylcarbamoyl transferase component Bud32
MSADHANGSRSDPNPPLWLLDLLQRFEAAWQQGHPPAIDDFLPTAEVERRLALVPLLSRDLEYRLRAGQDVRVEDYLRRFAELTQAAALCQLVAAEYELLRQRSPVTLTDYLHRFPQIETELRQHFGSPDLTADLGTGCLPTTPPPATDTDVVDCRLPPLRYKPVQLHDQGNLGEVHRAQDEELHREVALKRIQARHADNPDSRRRFLREARVTGRLEHPGVVPVYGVGEDVDGRPCYAMRFIQGESLAAASKCFHAADKPGRDPGERRLALRQLLTSFVTVCKTVAYAHSRGVIHRDLKPANIMLGKFGETLVVDWGLAKAFERDEQTPSPGEEALQPTLAGVGGATQVGHMVGTPAYCSPEQAAGQWSEVGPPSDIFSLGATLYNLLTNRSPYAGQSVAEIIAQATSGQVIPPRQRKSDVPRALEAICLKALARQRGDRYGTALALAADVEHWLADEPVQAYREPALVRSGRWLRHHRALVAGLVAAAVVALVSLTAVLVVIAVKNGELQQANQRESARAEAERLAKDDAQKRLEQIEKGTDVLGSIFADLDPHAEEKEGKPLREILGQRVQRAAKELEGESIGDALTVAKLQDILGLSLIGLGHYAAAELLLEKASTTRAAELGDDYLDALASANNLAMAHRYAGHLKQAMTVGERTLHGFESAVGYDHLYTLRCCNNLAVAYHDAGQLDRAIALHERTLKAYEAKLGNHHPETVNSRHNLAEAYHAAGKLKRAIPLYESALQTGQADLGEDHPQTLTYRTTLANAYRDAGQVDRALPLFDRTLKSLQAKLGEDHPETLITRNNLARGYQDVGKADLAIPLFERNLKVEESTLGADHPQTLKSQNNLASACRAAGQLDRAIQLLERTVKISEVKMGNDHPHTLRSRNNLALAYQEARQLDRALPLLEDIFKTSEAKLGDEHPDTLRARNNLALAYRDAGRLDRALPLFERTLKSLETSAGDDHPRTLQSRNNLAVAYQDMGKLDQALSLFEKVVPQAQRKLGVTHPLTVRFTQGWVAALESDRQFSRAIRVSKELTLAQRKAVPGDDPRLGAALALLGGSLVAADQPRDAEPALREALAIRTKKEPNAWFTFHTRCLLGAALLGQRKYADAEPLLVGGYQAMKQQQTKIPGKQKMRLTEALERLVQLYEATGKKDEAAKWRKELDAAKKGNEKK